MVIIDWHPSLLDQMRSPAWSGGQITCHLSPERTSPVWPFSLSVENFFCYNSNIHRKDNIGRNYI